MGYIYEDVVAQMLIANGAEMKADYYPWKLEWEEDETEQLK